MSESTLANLPLEIIRQIAHHGPFESVLNLHATSRALRLACHDWFIFCDFSECDARHEMSTIQCRCSQVLTPSRLLPWTGYRLDLSRELVGHPICSDKSLSVVQWLPALMARHRKSCTLRAVRMLTIGTDPLLLVANIDSLLEQFDRMNLAEEQAFLFCILAQLLSPKDISKNVAGHVYSALHHRHGLDLGEEVRKMCQPSLRTWSHVALRGNARPDWRIQDIPAFFVTSYRALIAFSTELRAALAPKSPWRFLSDRRGRPFPHPPTFIEIPLMSLLDFQSVGTEPHDFNTSHLLRMTSPEFLEEGSWSGYMNHQRESAQPKPLITFQTPIHRLRFHTAGSEADPDATILRSTSHDSPMTDFAIEGTVCKKSGALQLIQRSQDMDLALPWVGIMTPFGIFATLGDTDTSHGCWLWLWKDSWNGQA